MKGEELRKILYINGIEQKWLAEQIGMSQQSLSQMLSASDLKTGLLEKIVKALNTDMSFFYPIANQVGQVNNNYKDVQQNTGDNVNQTIGTDTNLVNKLLEELSELRKTNQKLTEKLLG